MRVMCVAKLMVSVLPQWALGLKIESPEIGSEYLVIDSEVKSDGLTYYTLDGFPKQVMDARAFAKLPPFSKEEFDAQHKEAILM